MGLFDGKKKELREATELDYSSQALVAVPKEIKQCRRLLTLNCSKNKLNSLPSEMGKDLP